MPIRIRGVVLCLAACLMAGTSARAADSRPPMADIHLHFNWNQKEVISATEVVRKLRDHNVVLAVVSGVPSELAGELTEAGGEWILPLFSPYIDPAKRDIWFMNDEVVSRTRAALASGRYAGIGEVHLVDGMGPRRDHPVFVGLIELAREFQVPLLLHTDTSDYRYLLPLCRDNPAVRFLWAHAGGYMGPTQVASLMEACANVWVELSARDPWHYGNFVDSEGRLLDGWRSLFLKYPQRFMTGTDPVWNAQEMYRWWEADEGWDHYGRLNAFHRAWMQQLPPEVEEKVRFSNAVEFFDARERVRAYP